MTLVGYFPAEMSVGRRLLGAPDRMGSLSRAYKLVGHVCSLMRRHIASGATVVRTIPSLNEMRDAIEQESRAADVAEAKNSYVLECGELITRRAGRFYYAFHPKRDPVGPDECPAVITVRGRSIPCSFSRSASLGEIQVVVTEDLGTDVPLAHVRVEWGQLYASLSNTIKSILRSPYTARFNRTIAERVLAGAGHAAYARSADISLPCCNDLASDIRTVVSTALKEQISYILAPRAGGTSEAVCHIIEHKLATGKTTLLISSSALQLDALMTALKRRCELSYPHLLEQHRLLRRGAMPARELDDIVATLEFAQIVAKREDETLTRLCAENIERKAAVDRNRDSSEHNGLLRKRLLGIPQLLLGQAKIVGATSTLSFIEKLEDQFDTVIICDAHCVPTPVVYYLCGLARESVTLVGDPSGLPPPLFSLDPFVARCLGRSPISGLGSEAKPALLENVEVELKRDFYDVQEPQMSPLCKLPLVRDRPRELVSLTNETWYGGWLKAAAETVELPVVARELAWMAESPVVLVDTSALAPVMHERNGSFGNTTHVAIVRHLWGLLSSLDDLVWSKAAVAVTDQQERLLRAAIEEADLSSKGVMLPCGLSGCSVDIVVLDTVAGSHGNLPEIINASTAESLCGRRLNAVLSSAKKHLIVVADLHYLVTMLAASQPFASVLRTITAIGKVIDARDLVSNFPVFPASSRKLSSTSLGKITPQVFCSQEALSALLVDLQWAQISVEISIPCGLPEARSRLLPVLYDRLLAGVRIRIVLGAAHQLAEGRCADVQRELRRLIDMGLEIWTPAAPTEHGIIIDGEVLWYGPLPFCDSNEPPREGGMVRIVGSELCSHIDRLWLKRASKQPGVPGRFGLSANASQVNLAGALHNRDNLLDDSGLC